MMTSIPAFVILVVLATVSTMRLKKNDSNLSMTIASYCVVVSYVHHQFSPQLWDYQRPEASHFLVFRILIMLAKHRLDSMMALVSTTLFFAVIFLMDTVDRGLWISEVCVRIELLWMIFYLFTKAKQDALKQAASILMALTMGPSVIWDLISLLLEHSSDWEGIDWVAGVLYLHVALDLGKIITHWVKLLVATKQQ
jgi:hypothetical protein